MKKFDRGGDVYGTINVVGQRPSAGNFGGNIFGGASGSQSGWSVPTAGTGRSMTEEEADAFARKFYEGWDPYGGQSVVDREAELNALLAEQGYLKDVNKPYGELPVFLTDLIGEYPTIGGNILPGDQGTAVELSAPTSTDTNILDTIKSIPGAAVDAAKSAADTLLKQIQEFLPFYDQSQVVINPRTGQATIVFGPPPSGSPVIQAGNLPKSNTNVGITTGISILDEAINSVLGKEGGLSSGSIRDEVIKVIFKQAGIDPAAAAVILGEDWGTVLANANTAAAETLSRFSPLNIDLTGEKDGVVRNTGSRTSTDLGEDTTVKGGGTDVIKTGAADAVDIVTGAGDTSVVTGAGDAVDIVTGANDSVIKTGAADSVIKTGSLTPADLGEDTTVKTGSLTPADLGEGTPVKTGGGTDVVKTGGGGGGGGGTATPATPLYGQGIRSMKTEKAGVTPLEDVFDIGDMSLANVLRLLAGEDDNTQGTPYYGGGSVNRNSSVDELIRLLRG